MHDALRAAALLARREGRPAVVELGRGAQLVHQRLEVIIVAPPAGGGAQATDLLVGRADQSGYTVRASRVQEHVAGEVRPRPSSMPSGRDERPPTRRSMPARRWPARRRTPASCRVGRGAPSRWARPRGRAAGGRAQLATSADHGRACPAAAFVRRRAAARRRARRARSATGWCRGPARAGRGSRCSRRPGWRPPRGAGPGVRRRPLSGSPTSPRPQLLAASPQEIGEPFVTAPACREPRGSAWPRQYQDHPGLPAAGDERTMRP